MPFRYCCVVAFGVVIAACGLRSFGDIVCRRITMRLKVTPPKRDDGGIWNTCSAMRCLMVLWRLLGLWARQWQRVRGRSLQHPPAVETIWLQKY